MKPARALALPLCAAVAIGMAACFSAPRRPESPSPAAAPEPETPPPAQPAQALPRSEPRSRSGNPPFYDVMGKRYYVLSSNVGYVERGVASWYGPGFHKVRTSTGEIYDMYGMSAAHKTLPLPAYVRVTNLQNGRSIVVRVNDRGPFVGNRIIDLSYTAAAKQDMLRNGTAMVEVRSLDAPPTLNAATTNACGPVDARRDGGGFCTCRHASGGFAERNGVLRGRPGSRRPVHSGRSLQRSEERRTHGGKIARRRLRQDIRARQ